MLDQGALPDGASYRASIYHYMGGMFPCLHILSPHSHQIKVRREIDHHEIWTVLRGPERRCFLLGNHRLKQQKNHFYYMQYSSLNLRPNLQGNFF